MDYRKDLFVNNITPKKPIKILMPIKIIVGRIFQGPNKYKIIKHNCENLKPPYIIISNHASNIDFQVTYHFGFPHPMNWIVSIEEFAGKDGLMRNAGCFYKRKFTKDIQVVKNIMTVLKKYKNIFVIYPEARFSFAGINEQIDGALGKLAKMANCPVVIANLKGNFITSPQWNKKPLQKTTIIADYTQIVTREEVATLTADQIQKRIEDNFSYDDYKWQYDNKIVNKAKNRATNLHKILYQCPECKKEFTTNSKGTEIWCEHCGAKWTMDEYGRLHSQNGQTTFEHIPDWYKWEQKNVEDEVNSGNYRFEDDARLELLYSPKKGFVVVSESLKYTHDENGFTASGKLVDGSDFYLNRDVLSMYGCHVEYNFKGRGDAVELCTKDVTYFVFPLNAKNVLTKIHFATQALYQKAVKEKQESENKKD